MPLPTVTDGIGQAADELTQRFGLARARFLADLWADQDSRWGLVSQRLAERAGQAPEVACLTK